MAKHEAEKKTTPKKSERLQKSALYSRPIQATRGGPLFNAFPYPTKISPETIALFIAAHTKPGQTVIDCFAGSGTTGIAAILCAHPTTSMKQEAEKFKIPAKWGPRRAVLYEIGVLGSFIARVLCSPPDPDLFQKAAEAIISEAEKNNNWLYEAKSPEQKPGTIRYAIWSDILTCPSCKKKTSLWEVCVSREPARISKTFTCPKCKHQAELDDASRVSANSHDDILNQNRKTRLRQPVWVYGSTEGKNWNRPAQHSDIRLIRRIEEESIPDCVPKAQIPWGDLYRSGYHEGITHLHHFYTKRNLIAFSHLWEQVQEQPTELQDALRFLLLSYNASHATIMTRVVAKKNSKDLVVTSAQPGVLYVSGLPVEKNIFEGLRRKLKTITQAFKITHNNMCDIANYEHFWTKNGVTLFPTSRS